MEDHIHIKFGSASKQAGPVLYQTKGLTVDGDEHWEKFFPLSHEQAIEILTRDLPPQTEIRITLRANGTGSVGMKAEGIFDESFGKYDMPTRRFSLKDGVLEDGNFTVNYAHRGSGIGRHVLRNEMEFFYQANVRCFNIHPSLSAGGYTWARQGFVPDDVTNNLFIKNTKEPVQARYEAIRPFLDKETTDILDKAVKFENPQDIWRIADSGPINGGLKALFNAMSDNADGPLTKRAEALKKQFMQGQSMAALSDIRSSIYQDKKVTAGRILLSGTDWHGHVDMRDETQMKRVGNYVGGWQHISP